MADDKSDSGLTRRDMLRQSLATMAVAATGGGSAATALEAEALAVPLAEAISEVSMLTASAACGPVIRMTLLNNVAAASGLPARPVGMSIDALYVHMHQVYRAMQRMIVERPDVFSQCARKAVEEEILATVAKVPAAVNKVKAILGELGIPEKEFIRLSTMGDTAGMRGLLSKAGMSEAQSTEVIAELGDMKGYRLIRYAGKSITGSPIRSINPLTLNERNVHQVTVNSVQHFVRGDIPGMLEEQNLLDEATRRALSDLQPQLQQQLPRQEARTVPAPAYDDDLDWLERVLQTDPADAQAVGNARKELARRTGPKIAAGRN